MTTQNLSIRYQGDDFRGLHCPICGTEVAQSESPCVHVAFRYLEIEPGDFSFVSDRFSETANRLLEQIDPVEGVELKDLIFDLNDDNLQFIIDVASEEYEHGPNSDLGIFGFSYGDI